MRMVISPRALAVAAALCVAPFSLRADAAPSDADALVTKGIELRRDGRDAEALEAFKRAYELAPSPRTRAQIALAEQALSQWLDAERDLVAALAGIDDGWIAKNAPALREALSVVESHLGWLEIACDVTGARVRIGGAEAGLTPLPERRVVIGDVAVDVEKASFAPSRVLVAIAARQHAKLRITLSPLPPIPGPAPERPSVAAAPAPRLPLLASGTLLGVSAATLVVGAFFGFRVAASKRDRDEHCDASGCDPDGIAADRDARFSATASTVALATAAVTGVAGFVILIPALSTPTPKKTASSGMIIAWTGTF